MKLFKKLSLIVLACLTCVCMVGCSFGGGSSSGGGNNTPAQPSNPGDDTNLDDITSTNSQPSINAIAGVYLINEESDFEKLSNSEKEKIQSQRQTVYDGVVGAAAGAITIPPELGDDATEEEKAERAQEIAAAREKQTAVRNSATDFLNSNEVEQFKIGLFESEITDFIEKLETDVSDLTESESDAVRVAIISWLSEPANVPGGSPVENDNSGVLVTPLVNIQVFKVKTYQVQQDMEGIKVPKDVKYLDDENPNSTDRWSTKDFGDDETDKFALPEKKWLSLFFEVAPGINNKVYVLGAEAYFLYSTQNDESTNKDVLKTYSAVLTAQSQNISVDLNASNYKNELDDFVSRNFQDEIDKTKEDNPNYEPTEEETNNLKNRYDWLNNRYGGGFEVNINCKDETLEVGKQAPLFGESNFNSVLNDNAYFKLYQFSLSGADDDVDYGIKNINTNLNNTIALHFVSQSVRVKFAVEGVHIGVQDRDTITADSILDDILGAPN